LLNRQIASPRAEEDPIDINAGTPEHVGKVRGVDHQASDLNEALLTSMWNYRALRRRRQWPLAA
jgi:hypothetical protein